MNKQWWLMAFIVVGVLLGVGVLYLVTRPPQGEPIILLPAPTPAPITVYVSGSVLHAGLYALPVGSRVNDAVQAAGGFSEQADREVINLAEVLEDGDQVSVPAIGSTGAIENGTRSIPLPNTLLDINLASLAQLDSLPEIGPVMAQRIIDYRIANGSFSKIEDLLKVDGIGSVTFDKVKDLITVGASP